MNAKFNYDYSKILWMKMYLAEPDFEKNVSKVFINFEQALEIIKSIDNITSEGNEYIEDVCVTDKKISLSLKAGQAVAIKGM